MPHMVEKILNAVLMGLLPPVPSELRSDYVQASPEEQERHRLKYAIKQMRWSRVASVLLAALMVKWAWECGFLTILGLGSGFAQASEVTAARSEQRQTRVELDDFRTEYRRDQLETRLRTIAAERVQIDLARAEAMRNGQRPLVLLDDRLAALDAERDQVQRQLERLEDAQRR